MSSRPIVSVAIANYNGEAFLEQAVRSALRQTLDSVEVIIVDDASSDASPRIAEALAAADSRVRFAQSPVNCGPAGARNHALALARGAWFAVLDNDDLYHPDRLNRLIARAEAEGADIIADDLLVFDDNGRTQPTSFLSPAQRRASGFLSLDSYLRQTVMYGRAPNIGFLKPVIRLDRLAAAGIGYDEGLRIAEDDDLVIRMLTAGMRYRIAPDLTYFYRKHGSSISHRLGSGHLEAMIAGDARRPRAGMTPNAIRALDARGGAFARALAFTRTVDALKARRPAAAVRAILGHPGALPLFRMPAGAAIGRIGARLRPTREPPPARSSRRALFISNQRLIGKTNGSSTYLLNLAAAFRDAGYEPHLVHPSPIILGRTPAYKLKPAMAAFETIAIRGVWRFGDWVVARDPAIHLAAARAILSRLLLRAGLKGAWIADRKAPYAAAAPWTNADRLFVAAHGRDKADVIVADYIFQTEGTPYALRPDAPSAIVMHDLFHARAGAGSDSVATVSEAEERAMLDRADAVIAIQRSEAEWVARNVPGVATILAPMAVAAVAAAQPGENGALLFVGSDTAPNILAFAWLRDAIWPAIRAAAPATRLKVAGSVGRSISGPIPEGVEILGVVDDLAGLYAGAGIVISPLTFGSGLKIKLVEAMAHGKAIVATSVTLQGVEPLAGEAVVVADEAAAFAAAVIRLTADRNARLDLANRALAAARRHFSRAACEAELRHWLADGAK